MLICKWFVCFDLGHPIHIAGIHRFLRKSKTLSILTVPNLKVQKNIKLSLGRVLRGKNSPKKDGQRGSGFIWTRLWKQMYSWFLHDVTKIQSKKLSLLLSFYFHVILEHLKTFIQKNVRFKRVLCFVIQDAWISRLFFLGAEKALIWVKNITDFWRFCYLNIPYLRMSITLVFMSSSRYICAPGRDTNMVSPYKSFIKLGKTFFRISRIWTIA